MDECTRTMGCTCPLCDVSAAAVEDIVSPVVKCTRALGCKCPQCDLSAAALSDITSSHNSVNSEGGGEDDSRSAVPAPTYTFCAINFNADREKGDAYDVDKDGKLGSVYTMLTEVLADRGDWCDVDVFCSLPGSPNCRQWCPCKLHVCHWSAGVE